MADRTSAPVRQFETLELSRQERRLTITLNRPDQLNAVDRQMHLDLAEVFTYAAVDPHSDVVLLTGAGRAFSAGGDINHMRANARNPDAFNVEARDAKRIVISLLEIEKPVIAKVNGHAVGLGATLAILCDVIFASDEAKIGDPHVKVGLVAGDGGGLFWPQLIGFARAKEYLLTGELLLAGKAAELGLINHAVPAAELDGICDEYCDKLLNGATEAIRWTKVVANLELKRIAASMMDASIAYEALSAHTANHREAVEAVLDKRKPKFS
jgi:enoyl-CoA hydratase